MIDNSPILSYKKPEQNGISKAVRCSPMITLRDVWRLALLCSSPFYSRKNCRLNSVEQSRCQQQNSVSSRRQPLSITFDRVPATRGIDGGNGQRVAWQAFEVSVDLQLDHQKET
jgi:hypothetical protein